MGSISALGANRDEILSTYTHKHSCIQQVDKLQAWAASITQEDEILKIRSQKTYKSLDRSVILALYAAQQAYKQAEWTQKNVGINLGSSRGATHFLETAMREFIAKKTVPALTSPSTSLGNISSWVAYHLGQEEGIALSHSITCSTALHAVANAVAWLESGRCERFIIGGSEAALTAFTLAQMKALRIYSSQNGAYPCLSLLEHKSQNSMVLGEGAACFALEKNANTSLAHIVGIGFATELVRTATSLSKTGKCLQQSMKMAIQDAGNPPIDAIVCHSPGTVQGDQAERYAIQAIFDTKNMPLLTSNKWKIGHTFGASGALSLEMAVLMLQEQQFFSVPFLPTQKNEDRPLEHILVNAVGFGGNAVSVVVSR